MLDAGGHLRQFALYWKMIEPNSVAANEHVPSQREDTLQFLVSEYAGLLKPCHCTIVHRDVLMMMAKAERR
jgi:hypothetical protein